MIKKLLNISHYNYDIFERRELPSFYDGIIITHNEDDLVLKELRKIIIPEDKVLYRMYNIPPYLNLPISDATYRKIELLEIDKGLLTDLSSYKTIQDFVNEQFSSKKRKQIRSQLKRLETCFNISYKFYYGKIDQSTYDFLLSNSKALITKRFSQLNKSHYHLSNWDLIKNNAYNLILEKKASIFVIYDNNKPINICFSYHFNNITYNILASFDTDYAKFSLGTIDVYKQLDWNISNGFKIFDMGIGESDYKFKWSNNYYDSKHHIIVKKKSILSNIVGLNLIIYLKIKFKLYRYHYNNPNSKLLSFLDKYLEEPPYENTEQSNSEPIVIKTSYLNTFNFKTNTIEEINIETENYDFLRNSFYNFIHSNICHKKEVYVYKLLDKSNTYIIKGNKRLQEIIIEK